MKIIDGWLDVAEKIKSPNCNRRPSNNQMQGSAKLDIDLIVVHSISLPPGQYGGNYIQDFFQNALDISVHPYFEEIKDLEVSSHLLIDREGKIYQFVNFLDRAWHAGESCFEGRSNCNDYSIGVELEGLEGDRFEEVQYAVLADLIICLQSHYPSITEKRIAAHSDISPGRKQDPGRCFDWQKLRSLLSVP